MINEILLRRKGRILFEEDIIEDIEYSPDYNIRLIATGLTNINSLGYTLSKEVIEHLLNSTYVDKFFTELIDKLKVLVGADVVYKPMYPNFPTQVMEMDEGELYLNAIVHYWSNGTFYPVTENIEERPALFDISTTKVLAFGTQEDYNEIFSNLMSANVSISEQDKEDLETFFALNSLDTIASVIPEEIPFKENMAVVVKLLLDTSVVIPPLKFIKTATDILRVITSLSGGDVSLASNTKYKSFKRRERRLFLSLLEKMPSKNREEDMKKYKNKWIRIGERLHPSEYIKQYPSTASSFEKLRNNVKIETFEGKVEEYFKNKDYKGAIKLLITRPSVFARMMNRLLCSEDMTTPKMVVNAFREVAKDIPSRVLWQIKVYFEHRCDETELRTFFPKGNTSKCYAIPNELASISKDYCNEILEICTDTLVNIYFSTKPSMGNVYISPKLKEYLIPYSQRSASKSLKTISRGSKISIASDANIIRPFIWWTNENSTRIDIDLSAAIFNENWKYMMHCSFTNLRNNTFKCYHSGDITDGGDMSGDGVAEFIDIDIDSIVKAGGRYVICQIMVYSGYSFNKLTNCRFGWMERADINSGEIFEPKTVQQKMDLTSDSTVAIPVIIDCVERKMIWTDVTKSIDSFRCYNTIENNLTGSSIIAYALTNIQKPTIYDLVYSNAIARGCIVDTIEEADYIFDVDTTSEYIELIEERKKAKKIQDEFIKKLEEEQQNEKDGTGICTEFEPVKIHIPKVVTAFDTDVYSEMI